MTRVSPLSSFFLRVGGWSQVFQALTFPSAGFCLRVVNKQSYGLCIVVRCIPRQTSLVNLPWWASTVPPAPVHYNKDCFIIIIIIMSQEEFCQSRQWLTYLHLCNTPCYQNEKALQDKSWNRFQDSFLDVRHISEHFSSVSFLCDDILFQCRKLSDIHTGRYNPE